MPVISSQFDPPWPLRNGHLQTILPAILRWRTNVLYRRERLELDDGDFLDLDWLPSGSRRLAVLSHGLEGSSRDAVMRGMAAAFGEVLLVAVPYSALPSVGKDLAKEIKGKVVIDASNPIVRRDGEIAEWARQKGAGVASIVPCHAVSPA